MNCLHLSRFWEKREKDMKKTNSTPSSWILIGTSSDTFRIIFLNSCIVFKKFFLILFPPVLSLSEEKRVASVPVLNLSSPESDLSLLPFRKSEHVRSLKKHMTCFLRFKLMIFLSFSMTLDLETTYVKWKYRKTEVEAGLHENDTRISLSWQ